LDGLKIRRTAATSCCRRLPKKKGALNTPSEFHFLKIKTAALIFLSKPPQHQRFYLRHG
jgi:hypothetical protein